METKSERPWVCSNHISEIAEPEDFKQPFIRFFENDYKGKTFGIREELLDAACLDLDKLETATSGDRNHETMDLAAGIADFDETERKKSNLRLLLVELKLDCISFNSLSKDKRNLVCKDRYSRDLLKAYSLEKKSFFIFTRSVKPQAERGFSQWGQERNCKFFDEWKALDPDRLNELLKFESDFPYRPITDLADFLSLVTKYIGNQDIDSLFEHVEYLRYQAESYYNRYKLGEVRHICDTVCQTLIPLVPKIERDQDYLNLLLDDFERLRARADI